MELLTPKIIEQLISNCPMLVALIVVVYAGYKIIMSLIQKKD